MASRQQPHHAQLEEWTDNVMAICGGAYSLDRTQILVDLRRTNDLLATVNRIYDGNFLEGTYLDPSYALILSSDIGDDLGRDMADAYDGLSDPGVSEDTKGGWSSQSHINAAKDSRATVVDAGLEACREMLQSDDDRKSHQATYRARPRTRYEDDTSLSPLAEGGFIREPSVTVLDSSDYSDAEPALSHRRVASSSAPQGGFIREEDQSPAGRDRGYKRRSFEEDQPRKRSKVTKGQPPQQPRQEPVHLLDSDPEDAPLQQNARAQRYKTGSTDFRDFYGSQPVTKSDHSRQHMSADAVASWDVSYSPPENGVAELDFVYPSHCAQTSAAKFQRSSAAANITRPDKHNFTAFDSGPMGRFVLPKPRGLSDDSDSDTSWPRSSAPRAHDLSAGYGQSSSQPVFSKPRRPLETVGLRSDARPDSAPARAGAAALNRFYGSSAIAERDARASHISRAPTKATDVDEGPDEPPPLPPPRSFEGDTEWPEHEINSNQSGAGANALRTHRNAGGAHAQINLVSDSDPGESSQSTIPRTKPSIRTAGRPPQGPSVPNTIYSTDSDDSDHYMSVRPSSSTGISRTQSASTVRPAPPAPSTLRRCQSSSVSTTTTLPTQTAIRALPGSIIRASQQRPKFDFDSSGTELDEPPEEADSVTASQISKRKGKERIGNAASVKKKRSATASDAAKELKEQAKAEKARLRAEKARETEEKKLAKQRETAARKAERSVNTIRTKTDCVKEMLVAVPHAFASPAERDLLVASLRELGAKAELVDTGVGNDRRGGGARPPLVWRRQVEREWDAAADVWRACAARVEDEAYVLLRMTGPDVCAAVSGGNSNAPFVAFHERVQAQHVGKTIVYLLEGVKTYLKRRAVGGRGAANDQGGDEDDTDEDVPAPTTGRKRNVPAAASNTAGPLTPATLDVHLVGLQLSTSLHPPDKLRTHPPPRVHLSRNFRESLEWIGSFTDQLSLASELAHRSEAAWRMKFGDNIRSGDGAKDTFRRMLMMVNGVTEVRANAVVTAWGSLRRLMREFETLGAKNGRTLLATLQVNSGTAANPNVRNLGPAVARRIHDVLMETDPALLLGG
ncbi:hypothetical protein HDU87_004863 [Geranomyces variabilis]|uniref:ERCC4 domain-containing protein n=1 Tax=Geranomyces variabilis TaxID=109894 RepID=A0AAD5TI66_9FUNG|nr:hypothetical protein HDU87_004863 [Geranomyces variabilis]